MRIALFLLGAIALVAAPELQAQPGPAPGMRVTETPGLGATGGGPKVCAVEMRATTKVVHGSVCKDYCRDHILPNCIRERLGLTCENSSCGTLRTYHVLTKKVIPGPEVPECRVKELPLPSQPTTVPGPVGTPP